MLDSKKNRGRLLPYLRNPDVRWFDVDTSNLRSMPFEDHEHERYSLSSGDVVVCEGGDAGRAAIWDGRLPDVKFQKAIHRVRSGPRLFNRFLVHRLFADHQSGRLADYFTGATIKHLTGQDLARYELVLPPLSEQLRIADVLDRADALRAKRCTALALLDTLPQSIFIDMFGDPIQNPRGYGVSTTIELVDPERPISYGILMPGPEHEAGVKYVRVVDMKDGGIELKGIRTTSSSISNAYRRSLLKPQDLLMSIRGHVGRLASVPQALDGANITQDSARLAIQGASAIFVRECLRTDALQRWMRKHIKGVAVRGINLEDVKRMPVILPPRIDQDAFAGRVAAVDKLKAAHLGSLAQLDALFASLQHRAFRGEL